MLELNDGLVCLSGCARHGLGVFLPNDAARVADAFGRERFYVELQRPYERGDARRNARLRELARDLGVATVATGDVHAHHPRRAALQDALVAIRCRTSLDGCEPERRGNHEAVLLPPEAMLDRFPDDHDAVHRTAELAARLAFDLTQELGYRYPDFSDGFETPDGQLRTRLRAGVFDALRSGNTLSQAQARRRLDEELALIAELKLSGFFLLHWEVLELANDVALEVRGRGSPRHALPPGPRARQLGRLDRLLPDRPLARRSGRGRPLARALPQPGALLGPRYRPRLPARHPREADRRGHRALRARARRARRRVLDVPLARGDPRPRQGARPAVRRARTAGAGHRGQPAPRRRGGRERCRATTPPRAGAPSASWRRRSAACRGTSRSTRAAW